VKTLRGKETTFLSTEASIRCLKIHNIHFLAENFERYKFYTKLYNIYYSVADLTDFPMCSFDAFQKKEQQLYLIEHFPDYVRGYSFKLDIDGHADFDRAKQETAEIKEIFDEFQVPYSLKMSGSGFHFEVDSLYTDLVEPSMVEKPKTFLYIARTLKNIMRLECLDAEVYDLRRIWKVPYSFDYKTGRIALPLTDEQFLNYSHEITVPENIGSVENRGLLTRFTEQGDDQLRKNFKRFVDTVVHGIETEVA
jgi:hypothetical protein